MNTQTNGSWTPISRYTVAGLAIINMNCAGRTGYFVGSVMRQLKC